MDTLGPPRWARLLLAIVGVASALWAVAELLGGPLPVVVGGLAVAWVLWQERRTSPRLATEQRARVLMGLRRSDAWGAPVVMTTLAVVCVAVGSARHDPVTTSTAVPLVLWAVVAALLTRRTLRRAAVLVGTRQP